ncbi:ATP/GTP-binding protein [Desulfofundulus thermosubterraneus]|uniref:AAA domain-containing protein n=1 Tax=Desulfofundulus thermosubterraneus DSM 16057 TaxID=1121432 RepID=A0A1M6M3B4_9FIRM|nr:ATP-binding protein [Desulfofundulus thermosubterraneus]SHJ77998.1 AAA domain-containing protein [Desulfofundulus thermosubterraneus DSM 16057]
MGKRIAITGAHGAGKTTLAKALSETLDLPLITERARVVARNMGIGHCRELVQNRALAWRFQEEVLEAQIRAQSEHPGGFVSDRSTLDCIAYFRLYLGDRFRGAEASRYYYRARFHAWRKLDLLVYVPPVSRVEPDGFRLEGFAGQVDSLIRAEVDMAEGYGLAVVRVGCGPVNERVAEVLAYLYTDS